MDTRSIRPVRPRSAAGAAAVVLAAVLSEVPIAASASQERAAPGAPLAPLNRFPRMVQEYYVREVRRVEEEAERRRAALKTPEDAAAHVEEVRRRIQECFGPWPERTPLNPRVTGTVDREAYRIEKIVFESRPGFLVTANLYLPRGRPFPRPGVVGSCGHSRNGKAAGPYQSFAQGLARLGLVCLVFDPLGQGERLQYPDERLQSRVGVGVPEHLLAGNQQYLVGEFLGSWRAWDGIRALDYLLSRPEVDPRHVGVTGCSGGGTMTTWLCGVERRWTMAAPDCFVTTFRRNLENELPADTEQCPPRALALGLDHSDFLAAMAPAPVVVLAEERDYFDVRGAEEAFGRLKRLYGLMGVPDRVGLSVGPNEHGFSREGREAMYRWFLRASGMDDRVSEPEISLEKDETLWCAPRGQVVELGSRSVPSFTRALSEELRRRRPAGLSGPELRERLVRRLRIEDRPAGVPPDFRILREIGGRRYPRPRFTVYAVETEPGIQAVVTRLSEARHLARPPRGPERAILYVAHHSSDAELREEPLVAELLAAEPGVPFYACDVRGVGESRPNTCGENMFLHPYGSDYFYAAHAIMLDRPYVGRKTLDVLRVLDWLASLGHARVHLAGRGWGAIPAAFAAILSDVVDRVTLKNALASYSEVAEAERYGWPLSAFVPGVLRDFDLPDCYRVLEEKKLRLLDPWGAVPPPSR